MQIGPAVFHSASGMHYWRGYAPTDMGWLWWMRVNQVYQLHQASCIKPFKSVPAEAFSIWYLLSKNLSTSCYTIGPRCLLYWLYHERLCTSELVTQCCSTCTISLQAPLHNGAAVHQLTKRLADFQSHPQFCKPNISRNIKGLMDLNLIDLTEPKNLQDLMSLSYLEVTDNPKQKWTDCKRKAEKPIQCILVQLSRAEYRSAMLIVMAVQTRQ